jgi:hypothetical protein
VIFGRKKKARSAEDETDAEATETQAVDEADEPTDQDETAAEAAPAHEAGADDAAAEVAADDQLDTAALDATEWRTAGPFEVSELSRDDDEPEDDQPRIDLGSVIITPVPGSELRLQVNESSDIVSAMLVLPVTAPVTNGATPEVVGSSALELSAYAAPRSGGLWAELRDEISAAATEVGGSAELAAAPRHHPRRRAGLPAVPDVGGRGPALAAAGDRLRAGGHRERRRRPGGGRGARGVPRRGRPAGRRGDGARRPPPDDHALRPAAGRVSDVDLLRAPRRCGRRWDAGRTVDAVRRTDHG